jgi:hypothetical protein
MRYLVIAPDGSPCLWTAAESPAMAVAHLLGDFNCPDLWAFARRQGYQMSEGAIKQRFAAPRIVVGSTHSA